MNLKVTKELYSNRISKKLTSNFIELGYGLQVEAMNAEMFFNRSFEPFFPYREINKVWFDLYKEDIGGYWFFEEQAKDKSYEKDWSKFDWYHSGYEHNAWFAFPGVSGDGEIGDESTFLVEKAPEHDVRISYAKCDYHGKYAMEVANDSEIWGGLAQEGKYCVPGMNYLFRGSIKNISGASEIKIEIYREGETADPVACVSLSGIGTELTEQKAEFTVPKEGRYTFALVIPPHSKILCDDFSLFPGDHVGAWKKSAVEAGQYVAPAVIRFPGGCFASFYDWHDGIGKNRTPDYSWFWGGYNYNDIGVDELAQYMEALGAGGMYCVNLHHPYKKYYELVPADQMGESPDNPDIPGAAKHHREMTKFANLEWGAQDTANLVEYCNGDENTFWGAKRAANGHPKPYGIQYWEMDNETFRWFKPKDYAAACALYSKKMKAVDPRIKIGMDCYTHSLEELPGMLEIAGKDIDFLADRGHDEASLQAKLDIIRAYNEKNGTNIKYCDTEWLPLEGVDVFNMGSAGEGITKSYMFSKWAYALNTARCLMMWQRQGDIVDFCNFSNWANTHAQSAIETAKEGSFVTAAGEILHMFANSKAAYVLKCEDYSPVRTDEFQVQVSLNENKDALVVVVLNRMEQDQEVKLDVSEFLQNGNGNGTMLYADGLFAMNKVDEQGIKAKEISCEVKDGVVSICSEKYSCLEIVIGF